MSKVGLQSALFSPGCVEDAWSRRWRSNKESVHGDNIPQEDRERKKHPSLCGARAKPPTEGRESSSGRTSSLMRCPHQPWRRTAQLACGATVRLCAVFFPPRGEMRYGRSPSSRQHRATDGEIDCGGTSLLMGQNTCRLLAGITRRKQQ